MASGSTAMLRRAGQDCLCQASTEHFQQCAEFLHSTWRAGSIFSNALNFCIAHGERLDGHVEEGWTRLFMSGQHGAFSAMR